MKSELLREFKVHSRLKINFGTKSELSQEFKDENWTFFLAKIKYYSSRQNIGEERSVTNWDKCSVGSISCVPSLGMVKWSIFSCELRAPLDHLTPPVKPITPKKKKIPACIALWKENKY
jgi:hypothetical protein